MSRSIIDDILDTSMLVNIDVSDNVVFNNSQKLQEFIRRLYDSGTVFLHVVEGEATTKPVFIPRGDCDIAVLFLSFKGNVEQYFIEYREVKHEKLCFV